ncbi:GNAT family N-acetyltransferase [Ollibium composti]|nr:GNAT family N-acetyltransferase [Mesorhizobium composti]
MTGLIIRPARLDDADDIHAALVGIAETVGELHKMTSTPDDIRRDGFGRHARFHTLIAEIDSSFAGMCLYFPIYSTWRGQPGAYVQDLFVNKDFRGLRIGERLLRHLARAVRDQGGGYIELQVDAGNVRAQRFYQRIGMERDADHVYQFMGESLTVFAGNQDDEETT